MEQGICFSIPRARGNSSPRDLIREGKVRGYIGVATDRCAVISPRVRVPRVGARGDGGARFIDGDPTERPVGRLVEEVTSYVAGSMGIPGRDVDECTG